MPILNLKTITNIHWAKERLRDGHPEQISTQQAKDLADYIDRMETYLIKQDDLAQAIPVIIDGMPSE